MPWNENGLSQAEAENRLKFHGLNELSQQEQKSLWRTILDILTEPMFLLLLGAAAIYLLLGDVREGMVLSAFALFSIGLVIVQERRSEHALEALRSLSAPQARVMRDGKPLLIEASHIVPGDVLLLAEGERIAADGVVRQSSELAIDESILTGESVPVRKQAYVEGASMMAASVGGEDQPFIFAGTLIVSGHGQAEVTTTGSKSQIGLIGSSLASIAPEATLLQIAVNKFVRIFTLVALVISACLVLWYGLQRGAWLQGVLSGIAVAMSMLPEEFPMALTVFLALGSWRLAQGKVLVRRSAVIETLGAATVLCVDKTGTLTENRMRVSVLSVDGQHLNIDKNTQELPEPVHRVLEYAMLASRRKGVDPMDQAVLELGHHTLASTEHLHPSWELEQEYQLTPQLLAMSRSWTTEDGEFCVAAKGAPEAIIELCHLDATASAAIMAQVQELAARGLRVIAVASSRYIGEAQPDNQHDFDFIFEGLIGLADPLRETVAPAVALAHTAGIKVAMITGDYPATALAIAREAGIDVTGGVLTGSDIEAMGEAELMSALKKTRVFARIMPAQKLRLVETLKTMGEVVAMTGDGVNDAPALKAAHIGIAMGERGTDVAREAASVVLLDEDFSRIVGGVQMGRRIFENLRKVMTYITAIHVPIAGLALIPVLMGMPPLLLPVHVAILEMLIDPMCSIAFEAIPADKDLMRRPPRSAADAIIGLPLLIRGALQGLGALIATLAVYWYALRLGQSEDQARTLSIVSLMAANITLIFLTSAQTSWQALRTTHKSFWIILVLAMLLLFVGTMIPASRTLLHFAIPALPHAAASALLGGGAVWLFSLLANETLRWSANFKPAISRP
ncbi:MAG TPA: cation-translocating P-type ATPase [Rhodocyclaceae bacterium]|nr:cation-translocating P-type ATPase [Rhodocyclaceae bacterium]